MADQTPKAASSPAPKTEDKPRSAVERDQDRTTGVTTGGTTPAQQDEFKALGVNPSLDNRTGDQRPVLPAKLKPQQIDGPEVGHFEEHAEKSKGLLAQVEIPGHVEGETLGMRSSGRHGRGGDED